MRHNSKSVLQVLNDNISKYPHNFEGYDFGCEKHIYVLECSIRNETWYYVGQSNDVPSRVYEHIRKDLSSNSHSANVDNLVDIYPVYDNEDLREKERECAYRTALKYDTTNVLGLHP